MATARGKREIYWFYSYEEGPCIVCDQNADSFYGITTNFGGGALGYLHPECAKSIFESSLEEPVGDAR